MSRSRVDEIQKDLHEKVFANILVNLGQISIALVAFDILHKVYIYKHKIVFIEIPEWKLKAKLARNTIFEGN